MCHTHIWLTEGAYSAVQLYRVKLHKLWEFPKGLGATLRAWSYPQGTYGYSKGRRFIPKGDNWKWNMKWTLLKILNIFEYHGSKLSTLPLLSWFLTDHLQGVVHQPPPGALIEDLPLARHGRTRACLTAPDVPPLCFWCLADPPAVPKHLLVWLWLRQVPYW